MKTNSTHRYLSLPAPLGCLWPVRKAGDLCHEAACLAACPVPKKLEGKEPAGFGGTWVAMVLDAFPH